VRGCIPNRSLRLKCAEHLEHVFEPSLWFSAWRCRCSDLEKDFPHLGHEQANFFFGAESEVVEVVDEDRTL
jgi:hypothetical protein